MPWTGSGEVVCADVHFTSVGCMRKLRGLGLRCVGVVKTSTTGCLKAHLSHVEMTNRGETCGVVHRDNVGNVEDMFAFAWMDTLCMECEEFFGLGQTMCQKAMAADC